MTLQLRPRISRALAGSDAAQILDGVHNHAAANGDQQDIAGDAHIFVFRGRGAQLSHHGLRNRVRHHIARQRLTDGPFFSLPWRHAAVVLFGKTWRAAAGIELLTVILADNHALPIAKIAAHPDILCRLLGLLTILFARIVFIVPAFFLCLLAPFALTGPYSACRCAKVDSDS